ncbi:uncharacterized protein CLUP02_10160 [Colletotrichum lupini]|uniref:Uncharacterized protein n=1 Tax=Colletotrichum lupini TaxID=145971 RepID=A0A9Q8SW82_9PEZI|nr:uncharacterized protein CLUP02_10160 [Colletotrichum lupini]UQC84664.1 hypothetical protein CLUP02_10160 [Colletotrichum lupini]
MERPDQERIEGRKKTCPDPQRLEFGVIMMRVWFDLWLTSIPARTPPSARNVVPFYERLRLKKTKSQPGVPVPVSVPVPGQAEPQPMETFGQPPMTGGPCHLGLLRKGYHLHTDARKHSRAKAYPIRTGKERDRENESTSVSLGPGKHQWAAERRGAAVGGNRYEEVCVSEKGMEEDGLALSGYRIDYNHTQTRARAIDEERHVKFHYELTGKGPPPVSLVGADTRPSSDRNSPVRRDCDQQAAAAAAAAAAAFISCSKTWYWGNFVVAPCKLHGNLLPLRCSGGGQPDRYLVPSTTSNRNTLVSFKRGSSCGLPWGHRPWLVSSADFGGDGGKSCVPIWAVRKIWHHVDKRLQSKEKTQIPAAVGPSHSKGAIQSGVIEPRGVSYPVTVAETSTSTGTTSSVRPDVRSTHYLHSREVGATGVSIANENCDLTAAAAVSNGVFGPNEQERQRHSSSPTRNIEYQPPCAISAGSILSVSHAAMTIHPTAKTVFAASTSEDRIQTVPGLDFTTALQPCRPKVPRASHLSPDRFRWTHAHYRTASSDSVVGRPREIEIFLSFHRFRIGWLGEMELGMRKRAATARAHTRTHAGTYTSMLRLNGGDAATELPLSIFFPDCHIPPFGMQAHEVDVSPATAPRPADRPYRAKNLGVFVFSLVAESYVGILSHFFSFAARPSDRANFDSARSASYSQKHSLSREPEIAAVNASCTGFRRCLQLCVGTEGQCAGILSDMRGGLLEGPWNSSVWVLHCIGLWRIVEEARRENEAWAVAELDCDSQGFQAGGIVDLLVLISPRPKSLTLPAYWVHSCVPPIAGQKTRLALAALPRCSFFSLRWPCHICFSFFPNLIVRRREFQQFGRTRRLVPASRSCSHFCS